MTTEVDVDIHLDVSLSSLQLYHRREKVLHLPEGGLGAGQDPGAAVSCLL